jgi:hypothetical protein
MKMKHRLGYIISSNPNLTLLDNKIVGRNVNEVKKSCLLKQGTRRRFLIRPKIISMKTNWIIYNPEFDVVIRVEVGAIIRN